MRQAHKNEQGSRRVFSNCDTCIGLTPHTLEPSGLLICEYCNSENNLHYLEPSLGHRKKKLVYRVH
jgi:hypothetical protein